MQPTIRKKQKTWPLPYHLQICVKRETKKLINSGRFEKIENVKEECSASPVLVNVEKEESVKFFRVQENEATSAQLHKMTTYAEYGRTTESKLHQNSKSTEWTTMLIENRFSVRIRLIEIVQQNKQTV